MFTFTLALFAGHQYFPLYFKPLFAERERRNLEESIHNKTTDHNYYMCWAQLPLFSLIRDFRKKKTPAETFPKFPSIMHVIDRSD